MTYNDQLRYGVAALKTLKAENPNNFQQNPQLYTTVEVIDHVIKYLENRQKSNTGVDNNPNEAYERAMSIVTK